MSFSYLAIFVLSIFFKQLLANRVKNSIS